MRKAIRSNTVKGRQDHTIPFHVPGLRSRGGLITVALSAGELSAVHQPICTENIDPSMIKPCRRISFVLVSWQETVGI